MPTQLFSRGKTLMDLLPKDNPIRYNNYVLLSHLDYLSYIHRMPTILTYQLKVRELLLFLRMFCLSNQF